MGLNMCALNVQGQIMSDHKPVEDQAENQVISGIYN